MVQTIPNQPRLMTPQDFCMWLHGFFELSGKSELSKEQVKMVHDHLNLMFKQPTVSFTTTSGISKAIQGMQAGGESFIC